MKETIYDKLVESEKLSLSEVALQKAMHLYAQIGREHNALRVYQECGTAMMRQRKGWKPHLQTE
jgi:hypothetical protein